MSKVKLVVKPRSSMNEGHIVELDLELKESLEVIGVIRDDFEPDTDGSVRSSADFEPVIDIGDMNHLVGKLLTLIDATFVDEKQREAMKDIFRTVLWDWDMYLRDQMSLAWKEHKESTKGSNR